MRTVLRVALGGLLASVAAQPVAAQDELIGFDQAYQLFTGKQPRAAAQMLSMASAEFRKELGRCRDAEMGGRMMETEPRIDALAMKIANGSLTSASVLSKELAQFDRLLAEHHQALAADAWSKPRLNKMETVARDLGLAAQYLERSIKMAREPISAEARKAVDDALAVAKRLAADPANPPPETLTAIEALGRLTKP